MNVAIISFHTSKIDSDMSGLSTSAFYIRDMLADGGYSSDILSMYNSDKFIDDSIIYLDPENYDTLNNYDYIIFITPGYTNSSRVKDDKMYKDLISSIKTPFSIMIHDEHYERLYPMEDLFRKSNYCRGYILVDELMKDRFEFLSNYKVDVSMVIPKIDSLDEIELKARSKTKQQISSTSRVITHKRQFELLQLYDQLKSKGIDIVCYGSLSANWTHLKIKNELSELPLDELLYGVYYPNELQSIMSNIMYHYDLCYYKVGRMNKNVGKRIELTTLEGLNEGCVPIISEEMKPLDLPDNAAIVIDKNCESDLVDILPLDLDQRLDYIRNMYKYVVELRNNNIDILKSHINSCLDDFTKENN